MEKKFTIELTERELHELFDNVDINYNIALSYYKDRVDFYSILYSKLSNALHNNSSDKSDKNEVGD